MPQCQPGTIWLENFRRCAFVCGSPEHPASDDCYSVDAGSYIEAGAIEAGSDAAADAFADSVADVTRDQNVDVATVRTQDPSLRPPRPIGPMSTSTVTSMRPTLQWSIAVGASVTIIELARSRAFDAEVTRIEVEGAAEVRAPVMGEGVWFWRLRSATSRTQGVSVGPVWWFRVGHRDSAVDSYGRTSLDLDGDGLSEVAVGGAGRVVVARGTTSGLDLVRARVLEGVVAGDDFGQSVASAGDVNGDGFGDFIVGAGAPLGRANEGYARVYFGSVTGIATDPVTLVEGRAGECFGSSVAGVGDMDGDGYGDVAVGVRGASGGSGLVRLYRGSASGLDTTADATLRGSSSFGLVVSAAGDLNADRRADLVVGALTANQAAVYFGRAMLDDFLVSQTLSLNSAVVRTNGFGSSVAGVGDMNGDGYFDIAVGAAEAEVSGEPNAGAVRVFGGSAGGVQRAAMAEIDGVIRLTKLGASLTGGDVNGDGFSDLLIGAPEDDQTATDAGAIRIVFGASSMIGQAQANVLSPAMLGAARFGSSVAATGDSDGDGLLDFVVTAPQALVAMGAASGTGFWFRSNSMRVPMTATQTLDAQRMWFGFGRASSN